MNPAITDAIYNQAAAIAQRPGLGAILDAASENAMRMAAELVRVRPAAREHATGRMLRELFERSDVVALVYTMDTLTGFIVAKGARTLWDLQQAPGTNSFPIVYLMVPDFSSAVDFGQSLGDLGDPAMAVGDLVA